ncbi:protein bicaudal D-like [Daphnia pulicaria]|uniref:protein bicaudal D-like n=1 Tax=Daphnia pulicaria TaxID=35523 RepID=UPI001EECBC14|nr:protein bicaudal D-like [Daphnia pulicaria]
MEVGNVEILNLEIERLTRELDQTNSEKIQSAQYGIVLLEEKENLQHRCEELESLFENARHELALTREALARFQNSHKVTTKSGIETEESLLYESAARETSLNSQILDLEADTKHLRLELERVTAERDQLTQQLNDTGKEREVYIFERKTLKAELKELKYRETRLLSDYSELEEENISLQKQVSVLRSSQVELEGDKHELRRLQEELELLNQQNAELAHLRKLAEKQMEEALDALQAEREAKYAIKKDLDARMTSESMFNLSNLAFSIKGLSEEHGASEGEDDGPLLQKLEASFLKTGGVTNDGTEGGDGNNKGGGDLFSEIHLNEVKKLERQLEQVEAEKGMLFQRLRDAQDSSDVARHEAASRHVQLAKLDAYLASLLHLHETVETPTNASEIDRTPSEPSSAPGKSTYLQQLVDKFKHRTALAVRELQQAQQELWALRGASTGQLPTDMEQDFIALKKRLLDTEQKVSVLHSEIAASSESAGDSRATLVALQSELSPLVDDITALTLHLCAAVGIQTGSGSHAGIIRSSTDAGSGPSSLASDVAGPTSIGSEYNKENISPESSVTVTSLQNPTRLLHMLQEQVRLLRRAAEMLVKQSHTKDTPNDLVSDKDRDNFESDVAELQEQIVKLKALLSTKREQIATLRTVVKANKQTAEVALANLKSKYETEKSIVSETMNKLRLELRTLKEEAATFSSQRALFAARCEEYVSENDELGRQLSAAEDEKRTLNSLLRMAIQQKLSLTERLEDLEMDRERSNLRRQPQSTRSTIPAGGARNPAQSQGQGAGSGHRYPPNRVPSAFRDSNSNRDY